MKVVRVRVASICLMLALILVGTATWVSAHSGAKGITKDRMDLMKDMAESMKSMGVMFKGEGRYDPAVVARKTSFLVEYAEVIPEMTPEGSNDHPSEALPIIWQNWDDYVANAIALAEEGAKLVEIANNGADQAAARAQYVRLGKTCGACHDRFRKPKE